MSKPSPVIYITKDKLEVYHLKLDAAKQATKVAEGDWNKANLAEVFTAIIDKIHHKKLRVLLADELSYSLEVSVPKETENERQAVKDKASEIIPGELADQEWDYKTIKTKLDSKLVKVFAPVKSFWYAFSQAVRSSGLIIEAVEPVKIAQERHQNPVIGLGLKTDLKGKDEEVLNMTPANIKPKSEKPSDPSPPTGFDYVESVPARQHSGAKKPLTLLLFALIIIALVIGGVFISRRSKKTAELQPSPSPTTEVVEPTEPSPSPESIDLSVYVVQILNGSGVKGEAGAVEKILTTEGFADIDTGNADNYDYADTEVSIKDAVPEAVFNTIKQALDSDYNVVLDPKPLTEESDYDLVIIVGEKTATEEE